MVRLPRCSIHSTRQVEGENVNAPCLSLPRPAILQLSFSQRCSDLCADHEYFGAESGYKVLYVYVTSCRGVTSGDRLSTDTFIAYSIKGQGLLEISKLKHEPSATFRVYNIARAIIPPSWKLLVLFFYNHCFLLEGTVVVVKSRLRHAELVGRGCEIHLYTGEEKRRFLIWRFTWP